MSPYARGVCQIALAAVLLSTFGLMIRFIETTSPWDLVFWRSLGVVLAAGTLFAARHRRQTLEACRKAGPAGVLAGVFLSGCLTFFVLAITHTTVAGTLFTMSIGPFVAAGLGWLLLGERVSQRTWLAMILAFVGMGLMFADGIATGHLTGQFFALLIALFAAGYFVVLRCGQDADMGIAVAIGGLVSMLVAFAPAAPLDTPWQTALVALALGIGQNGFGEMLIASGSRHVPVSQISLLLLIEVVLGPIWVWLAVGEPIAGFTLIGGAIILTALAGEALLPARLAQGSILTGKTTNEIRAKAKSARIPLEPFARTS